MDATDQMIYQYQCEIQMYKKQKDLLRELRKNAATLQEYAKISSDIDLVDARLEKGNEILNELNQHKHTQQDQVLAQKDQVLAQKDQALAEKDQALAQKDQALAQKEQALVQKDQTLAQKDRELALKEYEKQQEIAAAHAAFIADLQRIASQCSADMEQRKQERIENQNRTLSHMIENTFATLIPRTRRLSESDSWTQVFSTLQDLLLRFEPKYALPACLQRMQLTTHVDAGRELLGPFCHSHSSVLPILNGQLDLRFLDTPRRPAAQIRSKMAEAHSHVPVFLVLGVSGTGKSSSLMELAREHYTLFIQCSSFPKPTLRTSTDDVDYAFYTMSHQISVNVVANPKQPNDAAYPVILADMIIRWFFLDYLIDHLKDKITPLAFLLYQLQFAQSNQFFIEARSQLLFFPITFLWTWYEEMMQRISGRLRSIHQQDVTFLIGVDEAQSASVANMKGTFQSVHWTQLEPLPSTGPSKTTMMTTDTDCDVTAQTATAAAAAAAAYTPTSRGLLGPVLHVLVRMNLPIVICGTTLGLNSLDEIRSDVGKRKQALYNIYATEFIRSPLRCLSEWMQIDDCLRADPERFQEFLTILQGRPRLVTRIVDLISELYLQVTHTGMQAVHKKCDILEAAMRETVAVHTKRLKERLDQNRHSRQIKPLLFRMYISAALRGGKAKFLPLPASHQDIEWDLMQLGFLGIMEKRLGSSMDGHVRKLLKEADHHYQVWTLKEPFVMNLIRSLFSTETNVALLQTNLSRQMLEWMDEYGRKCSGKGFILEKMVGVEWCNIAWKNKLLSELPFLLPAFSSYASSSSSLPAWLSRFAWKCTDVDNAEGFTNQPDATEQDWLRSASGTESLFFKCLLPSHAMGPDLFLILPSLDKQDILFVQAGCKLFSEYVSDPIRQDQEKKLDLNHHRFHKAFQRHFQLPETYVPYQLKISIALPFTAADESLPRMEVTNDRSLLVRMNINDVGALFGTESVAYAILQYACQITTKDVTHEYESQG